MLIGRVRDQKYPVPVVIRHGMALDLELPPGVEVNAFIGLPRETQEDFVRVAGRHFKRPVTECVWASPVEPRAMRDFNTFEAHIAGMKKGEPGDGKVPANWYDQPVFLMMNPWSLVDSPSTIPMPPYTERLDFELEVAAIVAHTVRDVAPEDAAKHIAGYAIFNDWSARDIQSKEMSVGLGPSKGKDFANTLGPWIVTPDELEPYRDGDRYDLEMTVSINGEVVGADNLKHMSWSFEDMLVHASRDAWVGAGDVLASGTASTGALAERWNRSGTLAPPPLAIGDTVTMTVTGLGSITNTIGETVSPGHAAPKARRTYGPDRL